MSKLEAALSSYQAAMEEKMRKAAADIDDRIPSITIANGGTGYTSPPVLEGMTQTVTGKYFYSQARQCGKSWVREAFEKATAVAKEATPAPSAASFIADWMAFQETERAEAAAKAERDGMKEYPGSWPPPRMGFPPGSAY
jgi:hypothetical protein